MCFCLSLISVSFCPKGIFMNLCLTRQPTNHAQLAQPKVADLTEVLVPELINSISAKDLQKLQSTNRSYNATLKPVFEDGPFFKLPVRLMATYLSNKDLQQIARCDYRSKFLFMSYSKLEGWKHVILLSPFDPDLQANPIAQEIFKHLEQMTLSYSSYNDSVIRTYIWRNDATLVLDTFYRALKQDLKVSKRVCVDFEDKKSLFNPDNLDKLLDLIERYNKRGSGIIRDLRHNDRGSGISQDLYYTIDSDLKLQHALCVFLSYFTKMHGKLIQYSKPAASSRSYCNVQ